MRPLQAALGRRAQCGPPIRVPSPDGGAWAELGERGGLLSLGQGRGSTTRALPRPGSRSSHGPDALGARTTRRPPAGAPGSRVRGSGARFRRTETSPDPGIPDVGQRAQVSDQRESASLFSPFLLLKQALKRLEFKSTGHKQGGRRRPRGCPTGGEYHFYNLSIRGRVD